MEDSQNKQSENKQPDENQDDSNKQTSSQRKQSQEKMPRPPVQTFIFWLVILFALPLLIIFLGKGQQPEEDKLIQSEFERLLKDGRIESAVVIREPNLGITAVKGKYTPEGIEVAEEEDKGAGRQDYYVEITYTDELDSLLRQHAEQRDVEVNKNIWSNILISVLPILLLVALIYFLFSRQLKSAGKGALQFGKSRAQLAQPTQETVTFDDVAGVDEAKEDIQEIVEFLSSPQKFQNIGGKIPKGALMIGPPGTGKTLLARAISGEAEVPFFSISGSDFVEMFVGVGASRVRDMFEEGKKHAPCLIFIDEIDAVGRSRFSGIGGGHDEREQTLNALLAEMDGFEPNTGIIVLAATNRPDVLDPALLRPGRFDRRITVDLPDMQGRLKILNIHCQNVKIAKGVDLTTVAKGTPGFSGADLANLINEAALGAARRGKKEIDLDEFEEARDKVRWGKERRSRALDKHDREITAYHEAGHTLVSLHTNKSTPLHKVTIVPRGQAYLGATMSLPEKDRYTQSKSEIEDELIRLMGGRLAEKLMFNDVTNGAGMDLRQATDIARKMVCEWGMSDALGPLAYGSRQQQIYLGRDITKTEDYSEETARKIDDAIRNILTQAEERAQKILDENIEHLKLLGNTLLEKETLGVQEIRELLNIPAPPASEDESEEEEAPPADEEGDEKEDKKTDSNEPESEDNGAASSVSETDDNHRTEKDERDS